MISHEHSRFSDPDYDPDRLTGLDEYDGPDYAQELRDELREEQAAMSTKEHEEYVRSKWEDCGSSGPVQFAEHWQVWCDAYFFCEETEQQAWSLAYAFTLEREEQIRCIKREIEVLQNVVAGYLGYITHRFNPEHDSRQAYTLARVIAREQAALAELKRGMK